jgi:hypothetical protein
MLASVGDCRSHCIGVEPGRGEFVGWDLPIDGKIRQQARGDTCHRVSTYGRSPLNTIGGITDEPPRDFRRLQLSSKLEP